MTLRLTRRDRSIAKVRCFIVGLSTTIAGIFHKVISAQIATR